MMPDPTGTKNSTILSSKARETSFISTVFTAFVLSATNNTIMPNTLAGMNPFISILNSSPTR